MVSVWLDWIVLLDGDEEVEILRVVRSDSVSFSLPG